MIHATWSLDAPSLAVSSFTVYYTAMGSRDSDLSCQVEYPSLSTYESEDCRNLPSLQPCSQYQVTVAPFDRNDDGIGYSATELEDTLPSM